MPNYDLQSMKNLVEQCDKNIKIFEKAIHDEMLQKFEYQKIVKELEISQNANIDNKSGAIPKISNG